MNNSHMVVNHGQSQDKKQSHNFVNVQVYLPEESNSKKVNPKDVKVKFTEQGFNNQGQLTRNIFKEDYPYKIDQVKAKCS